MLSAFTARPIVELRARDKLKIESILAYGDRLLVGLSTGTLRIYRVNEIPEQVGNQNDGKSPRIDRPCTPKRPKSPAGPRIERPCTPTRPKSPAAPKPVDLLRELDKFSTRSIEQLAIIKEANTLISLSNSYVSIHDLQSYELQEQLAKTKGASTFATTSDIVKDTDTGVPEIISRLAVAVKRRLLLWSWHESELSPDVTEITLASAIRTLTWASATKIICGLNSGYLMVDVITQEFEDIVGPGAIGGASGTEGGRFGGVGSASMGYMGLGSYVPKPLATRLADGEMVLAKDINTLFIDSNGKPKEKRQIPWASAPDSIGYSYPYMIALQAPSKGAVEVRNPETLSLLQTISLPNATQLHFPSSTVSLAHAGKGFHVVSERCVWRMGATDYDTQIDELVDSARYDEAISILNMLEDALLKNKTDRLREVKMLKAQSLFDQRKYRQAIDLFSDEHVQAPPERVIRLYPPIIAGELSTFVSRKDTNETNAETNSINSDVPALAPEIMGSPKPGPVNKVLNQHKKLPSQSDAASIRSTKKADNNDGSDTGSIRNSKQSDDTPLEGKDLKDAVLELRTFLAQSRARMQRFLDFETGRLKPEASSANGGGVNGSSRQAFDSLLVAPSSEADADREQKLRETAILVDTTLFRAYMFASPSLAGSLFRINNFCDPDVVNEKLLETGRYSELVDFFHGKKLHRPALELLAKFGQAEKEEDDDDLPTSSLHGPQRTVGYLQNLPPEMIDLILEFAKWPLQTNPELGMEIFVADSENAETLPRDRVAKFLGDIDIDLEVKYLEHVTEELNDLTPEFHDRLVAAYLQELKSRDDRESESWKGLMERLLTFLRGSQQYSLSRAFGLIPRDDPAFYEAQAVVLSNMGQHKQALEIYVFKLKDFEKAEEYCNYIHLLSSSSNPSPVSTPIPTSQGARSRASTSAAEDAPSIYHTLLSLYLTPPPPNPVNFEPALSLLSKHGARLPASSTLSLLPASIQISKLESYFKGRIRNANSIVNESRIVAGLRKSEVVAAQAMLRLGDAGAIDVAAGMKKAGGLGRNRRVVIGEERVCGGCFKRLGGSVVVALPDNSVVHYGCLNRVNSAGGVVRKDSMSLGGGSGGMEALRRGGRA